jgi:hypothetical protein
MDQVSSTGNCTQILVPVIRVEDNICSIDGHGAHGHLLVTRNVTRVLDISRDICMVHSNVSLCLSHTRDFEMGICSWH